MPTEADFPPLGVCSWSLRPSSPEDLASRVAECRLQWVQLALDPLRRGDWNLAALQRLVEAGSLRLLSGMMGCEGEDYSSLESIRATGGLRPDGTWAANRRNALDNARLARTLGLDLITFHAGFLPPATAPGERARMAARLRECADVFADHGLRMGLETGQESATTLLEVLEQVDRPSVGVNFDPANMILYGMGDPVAAVSVLAPRVVQVHVKDALPSTVEGLWGTEVPVGAGSVDWPEFFDVVDPLRVPLVIEREAGEARVRDIGVARELVQRDRARRRPPSPERQP